MFYPGSCDPIFTKTLCLHIPSLLPGYNHDAGFLGTGGVESSPIEVSPLVQAAALAGFGLLYCKSGNRQIVEFLLGELYVVSETSNRLASKECCSLSASWALGMILLGQGANIDSTTSQSELRGLSMPAVEALADLKLTDRLLQLLNGGVIDNSKKVGWTASSSQRSSRYVAIFCFV
jgi:hypothetical protein